MNSEIYDMNFCRKSRMIPIWYLRHRNGQENHRELIANTELNSADEIFTSRSTLFSLLTSRVIRPVSILFCFFIMTGCETSSNYPSNISRSFSIGFSFFNGASRYDSIRYYIKELQVYGSGGWHAISAIFIGDGTMKRYQDNRPEFIGAGVFGVNYFTSVIMKFYSIELYRNGIKYPVAITDTDYVGDRIDVWNRSKSGFHSYSVYIDLNSPINLKNKGTDRDPIYEYHPQLRAISENKGGAIMGYISNFEAIPIVTLNDSTSIVSSSSTNDATGSFSLNFIPEGIYTISVKDSLNRSLTKENVKVKIGEVTYLGMLTLK